ncbi:MauE/DoxX family redox-associated membrane protein [Aequorivita marisscotiae]|uniref:MauE/DoxX family redox-associated membrane protein n=1 Tax=Aequorivita marisscotiae TaxID=3040348 RepID=A0ABY8KRU8_9FLAO|nr:MauE/DoxX family redox-associated membrane protein [Aequorivita sp. Ant34-E75]WGF92179.1 MauE/DoxX family redox-associated membrane protein [Aequorivita sp. Ant34-E75]
MALPKNRTFFRIMVRLVSYLFILLFVYAAISKLLDFETFTVQLAQSPLLSAYAGFIAWLVPGIEMAIALLLMVPKFRTIALYAAFTLMAMFTAYIFIILNYSDFIPCSCGGVLEKMSWTQHFIFNLVFIILAGVVVFFTTEKNNKAKLLLLATLIVIGIGIVTLLFAFSERKMLRNNAFIRRYPPTRAVFDKAVDLAFNSWYIAGADGEQVYLGNSTAPLNIKVLNTELTQVGEYRISLDEMELPFTSVKINVLPPYFYVADGMVPVIFRGNIADWKATRILTDTIFFTNSIPIDSVKTAIRFVGGRSSINEIGIIDFRDTLRFTYTDNILKKQVDGLFDTDGQLLYNRQLNSLVYIYFYRNEYICFAPTLNNINHGKTIDTVSIAQVKVGKDNAGNLKLASPSYPINVYAATFGTYLYVQSDRLGRFEPKEMLKEASIIDVYDLLDNTYLHSFYIYHHKKHKMNSFTVNGDKLFAIMDKYLVVYELR